MCLRFIFIFLFSFSAYATNCPSHYSYGQAPKILNAKLAHQTQEVCYQAFGVMHSAITRTPLWSAEYLTRKNIATARSLSRQNTFHPEPNLLIHHRAELADYAHSGFDRGHMSPSADMGNRTAQQESFSLANMVPQNPENNRRVWAAIEHAVRKLAVREGALYVITGPAFLGKKLQKIGNVIVPSHLYKVIYSPNKQQAAAYFISNTDTVDYQILSVPQLESILRINLLPGVPTYVKNNMLPLPDTRIRKVSSHK